MATCEIDVTALGAMTARLAEVQGALAEALAAANDGIIEEVRGVLETSYSPRLARLWETESASSGEGELAMVRVWTDDKRVYGYEFGTRAHGIAAHQPPAALHFDWRGASAFFRSVNHPGTRPHNRREGVKIALGMSAREQWAAAIAAALSGE